MSNYFKVRFQFKYCDSDLPHLAIYKKKLNSLLTYRYQTQKIILRLCNGRLATSIIQFDVFCWLDIIWQIKQDQKVTGDVVQLVNAIQTLNLFRFISWCGRFYCGNNQRLNFFLETWKSRCQLQRFTRKQPLKIKAYLKLCCLLKTL